MKRWRELTVSGRRCKGVRDELGWKPSLSLSRGAWTYHHIQFRLIETFFKASRKNIAAYSSACAVSSRNHLILSSPSPSEGHFSKNLQNCSQHNRGLLSTMPEFDDIERRRKKTKSSYTDIKKHYVRMDGWLPVFRRYSELRGEALRYLTLCAKYAIDVRYFRQKGVLPYDEKQKIYPTLTFIEKDAQDYAIIAESLGTTKLGIRGDLEDILVNPARNTENARKLTLSFP